MAGVASVGDPLPVFELKKNWQKSANHLVDIGGSRTGHCVLPLKFIFFSEKPIAE
jgi:hypothetical protein